MPLLENMEIVSNIKTPEDGLNFLDKNGTLIFSFLRVNSVKDILIQCIDYLPVVNGINENSLEQKKNNNSHYIAAKSSLITNQNSYKNVKFFINIIPLIALILQIIQI